MTPEQAQERIQKLKEKILKLNYDYFVLDTSNVSEEVRDSLKRELRALEEQFPQFITPDSPTQRVGSVLSGRFAKIAHLSRKWSLQDVFNQQELQDWMDRIQKILPDETFDYIAELKIDGLNITLHYEQGKLVRGVTRGNGVIGEDVLHTIKTIESIPLTLTEPVDLEISGEVYMTKTAFRKMNAELEKEGLEPFANVRNAAAGTIRQLDPQVAADRDLQAFFYSIGQYDFSKTAISEPQSQSEILETFKKLGLAVNRDYKMFHGKSSEIAAKEIAHYLQSFAEKREKLDYEIDGIVIKVNSRDQSQRLGHTGKAPRGAIAFKFPAQQVTTHIEDIKIQVGRTGTLTPVAHLKPVEVSGVVVSRATLHNEDEIERKDVRIGDTVIIQRAGDVIPEVVEVLKDLRTGAEKKFHFPVTCPVCDFPIERKEGEVAYRCTNGDCFGQKSQRMFHFAARNAMNIEGLGEKVIVQLLEEGIIEDPADLLMLRSEDLMSLPLFKEKKTENTLQSIEKSKKVTLDHLIFALGIRYLGEQGSAEIANYFLGDKKAYSLENLAEDGGKITIEQLSNLEGIGPKVAEAVYGFFHHPKNIELIRKLQQAGVEIQVHEIGSTSAIFGKSFVLTGGLTSMSRDEAKEKIKKLGGKIHSGVTRDTNFVIVGQDAGSKAKKADELGIQKLSEEEFLEMLAA